MDQQHRPARAALHHQEALQLVPAIGIAGLEAGEAREIVEHHQFGVVPHFLQASLALVVAEVGQRVLAEVGHHEFERRRRRAEEFQARLQVDGRHLAVDIEHAVRPAGVPVEEARARGDGPGDAHRQEGLALPARAVEQGEAVVGQDRVEQRLALGEVRPDQLFGRELGRHLDGAIAVEEP